MSKTWRPQRSRNSPADGSADIINGTSDWVSEEELRLRNCFRWSPDGQSIAYWQFDQSGVGEYTLINDTAAEYPRTMKYKYPQPGTTNSSVRAGVVPAAGGPTRWIKLEGDPRQHYIARDGVGRQLEGSDARVSRPPAAARQTDAGQCCTPAKPGFSSKIPTRPGSTGAAPLDRHGPGKEPDLLWISERDGWRHAYRVDRATGAGAADHQLQGRRDLGGRRSTRTAAGSTFWPRPTTRCAQYLYRSRLDGQGAPERVTPPDAVGTNTYDIAPNGHWASHTLSTFTIPAAHRDREPARTQGRCARWSDNHELAQEGQPRSSAARRSSSKCKVANGVTLDGWMMKPPDFDPAKKYPVLDLCLRRARREPRCATRGAISAACSTASSRSRATSWSASITRERRRPRAASGARCVYGAVGVLSAAQQAQAIQELARERSYIDTSRMAIWGWSGGGSNTLNVMFRYPGVYSTGIAVAPVRRRKPLRHHLPGALHGPARGQQAGLPRRFADQLRAEPRPAICWSCTAPATTMSTSRERNC